MGSAIIVLPFLVLGVALYGGVSYLGGRPGRRLRRRFGRLGDPERRTFGEIVAIVGEPTCSTLRSDGALLYQWIADGYQIALAFRDDACVEAVHRAG